MRRHLHILAAMILALSPSLALANGLIPAVTAYRQTSEFFFVFTIIVLIEAVCIRLWLRSMHLVSVVWRVLLMNVASSFAGYLLTRTPLSPDFTSTWQQAIPFFFLTLCVELPLMVLLFRRISVSWRQKVVMGIVANVLSYAFLIMAERPVQNVWLDRLRAADYQVLAGWTNTQMLAELPGVVYGTESLSNAEHRLRYLDLGSCRWHSMTNCPKLDPRFWDVEGDLAAFFEDYAHTNIAVRRLPDFSRVADISITNAPRSQAGGSISLKISPDRTKVAALLPLRQICAPLRGASYRIFGMICDVRVYDIASGGLVGVSPRKASQGLCWLPDSRRVLFRSLRDESLHELATLDKDWKKKYSDAGKTFSDAPAYAYDIEAGSVAFFGDLTSVHLATEAGQLIDRVNPDRVRIIDPATGRTHEVQVGRLGYRDVVVAPDGRFAIVPLTLENPMAYLGYPVFVDLKNPARRYSIRDGFDYRWVWTSRNGSRTDEPVVPAGDGIFRDRDPKDLDMRKDP